MPLLNKPPPYEAELPLIVQSSSVAVSPLPLSSPAPYRAELPADRAVVERHRAAVVQSAPAAAVEPPVIVRPEIDAVTPFSTWNTWLA